MKNIIAIFIFMMSCASYAQYSETLPRGVRLILNKNIRSEVSSSFNKSRTESPFKYRIEADNKALSKINDPRVQQVLDLFREYPEAYNALSLGTHKLDAKAQVNVSVYGFGYGITNKMTAYIGVPIYDAKVKLKYEKEKNSSQKDVAKTLQAIYGDNWAQLLGNIVEKVYDIDAGVIQSGVTNALGYDELGDWSGNGLGDIEFGLMYNLYKKPKYGYKLTLGGVAPTGYVDDPDTIQDIGFGDGQWDIFTELGGDYKVSDSTIFNAWTRATYQFASEKKLRIPFNEEVNLGDTNAKFKEKLGNKILFGTSASKSFTDWFSITPSLTYEYIEAAKYESNNSRANELLAKNSDSSALSSSLQASFSTVKLFQKKAFFLPGTMNLSYQTTISGQNTPKVTLYELEFRMFF